MKSSPGLGAGVAADVNALTVFNDGAGEALYAGGNFTDAGGIPAGRIAKWDRSVWTPLGGGVSAQVLAMTVFSDRTGDSRYSVGDFLTNFD